MKKFILRLTTIDSDNKAYLFNLVGLLLIYWPISFLVSNFKWDMADQALPWRHYISLSILNGEFPLWNAHQLGGYPIHADPQSGAFYPMVWILTLVTGTYTVFTNHLEFIITVFIASCGFYKLCRFFSVSIKSSAIAGLMYACSGVFISNMEHFSWIISACYLPAIFYCFFSLSTHLKYKHAIALSILLYLLLTGGYPGFAIILFYILIVFFIYFAIVNFKTNKLQKYLVVLTCSALLTLVFSIGFLYSVYLIAPYISRGEGVTLHRALMGSFTPTAFLSFIIPFATSSHRFNHILQANVSMSNIYFGIFFLMSLPFYFIKTKKGTLEKIILVVAISCLLIAVGKLLPFRTWLYEYVPFMNLFRFPSSFRIFVIIFLLLLATIQIDKQKDNLESFRYVIYVISFFLLGAIFFSLLKNNSGTNISVFFINKNNFREYSSIYDHIIIHSAIVLALFASFMVVVFRYRKNVATVLYVFILIDIYLSVHLNLPFSSLDYKTSPRTLNEKVNKLPDLPYVPKNKISLNNDKNISLEPLHQNVNDFFLEIGYDGYNPLELKLYDSLKTNKLFSTIKNNYAAYVVKNYISTDQLNKFDTTAIVSNQIALVSSSLYSKYKSRKSSNTDTCSITALYGNRLIMECSVKDTALVTVFQNRVPGWECKVNEKDQKIEIINIALMGIQVPPGKSTVLLEYKPKGIYNLIVISISSLLLFVGVLLVCLKRDL